LRIDFPGVRNRIGGGGGKGGRELDPSPRDVGVDGPASAELVAIAGQIGQSPRSNKYGTILHPVWSSHETRNGHSSYCRFNAPEESNVGVVPGQLGSDHFEGRGQTWLAQATPQGSIGGSQTTEGGMPGNPEL
jgi:hypothetical protein